MNYSAKRINIKKLLTILAALFAIVVTVVAGSYVVVGELRKQLRQNLEDVANQNAVALYNRIHSNHLLLEGMSENMHGVTTETVEETLQSFTVFIDDYELKRFAFCFPDGTCYSTDGGVADLSFREFFKRGMEGKGTISGVLSDVLEESHGLVNVMTIPIFDDNGNVEGVLGLTYNTQTFNDALQIDCFDGQGYSCAINEDGQIMVAMGSNILQLSKNIFSDVLGIDQRNQETISRLQKQMSENVSGGGQLFRSEGTYYYCTPVELMDGDVTWYMLTIIPADVFENRADPIQTSLYVMIVMVALFIIIGAALLLILSREQQMMMLRFAYEDHITKGDNYAKFCINMEKRKKRLGYLVAMDITNFGNINIAAGKNAGDALICDIWQMLVSGLQEDEFAAHVRDDIYIMFLLASDDDSLLERLKHISDRINRRAKQIQVKGIHARYGIYHMNESDELQDAYGKARMAREHAKIHKEQRYAFYDEIDHERIQQDEQLEERFEESLKVGDFEVWYQPKYSAASGEIVGSEALVRWRDKDGSMVSPGRFIPLFEQNGMIAKLDEYMFRAVTRQQAKWKDEGRKIYPVSINLSRASLYYADIFERYQSILKESGIEPEYIQLEVTESAMEGKKDIRVLLEQFRNMGIQILMDDFGTGYSSLATLNMRCFDTIKLDKSLIDHIGDKNGEILLCYIIDMGHQLELHITAEGVENPKQLEFLKQNKCDDIQGFLFARPMPFDQFEKLLAE